MTNVKEFIREYGPRAVVITAAAVGGGVVGADLVSHVALSAEQLAAIAQDPYLPNAGKAFFGLLGGGVGGAFTGAGVAEIPGAVKSVAQRITHRRTGPQNS